MRETGVMRGGGGLSTMALSPENDDVVIWQKRGNLSTVYLLGTLSAPDQYIVPTRDDAVLQALAFARRECVGAWFAHGIGDFVPLGTFRREQRVARTAHGDSGKSQRTGSGQMPAAAD